MGLTTQVRSLRGHPEFQASPFEFITKQLWSLRIELAFHQMRVNVHDGHVQSSSQEAARCLEAEQSSPDHDRVPLRSTRGQHGVDILHITKSDNAPQSAAGDR